MPPPTAAEVAGLAQICGAQGDIVLILAYTGLRFGELTGLNVEDVDLGARRLRVRRSMTQVGGRLIEDNPKSEAGRRSVPIPERLMPTFKARVDARPAGAPAIVSPEGFAVEPGKLEARGQLEKVRHRDWSAQVARA